ncbi:hypothetical protein EZS27_004590 [termite gut metagenome]|uniref:Phage tail tape measure protein domain-containing protein n=1 Tax=termite gut metagenome TaxID=433724 RepID=A0A5J4SS59_9ZZZZ
MSLKIDRVQLEIIIQQDSARQKMVQLEGDMKKVRKELKGLTEGTQEWTNKRNELKKLQQEYDKLFEGIGLGSLSLKELHNRQAELNAVLRQLPGDSPLYAQYKKQLDEINARMKELRGTAVQTQFSLSKMADGFNRYAGMAAGAIASLTGITLAVRKSVDDFAKLEETEAGVRKYTGMTRQEVKELGEEFKKMDTRTARERLNELAADAGRLGIQGKKDLLEFADAANVINVSLGEDLGEDAVKNIGKLAQMFGDDKRVGLRGAMLSTASAINEVAQNSSASEQYLVDFTARVAGTGKQAGISQAQIMGFASTLDQDMQQVEMSATALQTVIMKVYQAPAKFAKYAGRDVKEFTNLLKTDANSAILQLLENIKQAGGLSETAPLFKEMKLDGARAAGVLNTLAANVDKIRVEQERATQAYKEGTSVINEYNIQNNTLQGQIEKAKKGFKEISYELGKELAPHMGKMISTGGMLVKSLIAIVSICIKYGGTITYLATVLGTYVTVQKLVTLWTTRHTEGTLLNIIALKAKQEWTVISTASEKLYAAAIALTTGNIRIATQAMRAFFTTLALNPVTAIVTAVVALGVGIYKLATYTSDAQKALQSYFEQSAKEQRELRNLTEATKAAGEGTARRKELIEEINTKYGKYLPNLLTEYSNLKDIEQAYKDINTAMDQNIAKKVLDEKTEEIHTKGIKAQADELKDVRELLSGTLPESQVADILRKVTLAADKNVAIGSTIENTTKSVLKNIAKFYTDKEAIPRGLYGQLKDYVQEVAKTAKKVNEIKKEMSPFLPTDAPGKTNQLDEVVITAAAPQGKPYTGGDLSEKELHKALKKKEEILKNAMYAEQALLKEQYANKEITEKEYNAALYKSEITFLSSKKKLLEDYKQDSSEVQKEIYDKMISEANRLYKAKQDAEKKAKEGDLKALESSYESDQAAIKEMYLSGKIKTEEKYHERMLELDLDYLESRKQLLLRYGEDTAKIEDQIADKLIGKNKDDKDKKRKAQETEMSKTTDNGAKLDMLQAMYDADLINYEEYEKQKVALTKAYEKQREDTVKAALKTVGDAAGAAGLAQIGIAKKQMNEAKGLQSGGFSDKYVQGFTDTGNPSEVAGVIPVHKNEFVTNHEGVANPHVKQFLDVFDMAQKNGTIRMINTTQILERIRVTGKYEGGYTNDSSAGGSSPAPFARFPGGNTDIKEVVKLLTESNRLLVLIKDKELAVDSRAVRDGIKRIENLERNVSR